MSGGASPIAGGADTNQRTTLTTGVFGYHEENLESWALETLTSLFAGDRKQHGAAESGAEGRADEAPGTTSLNPTFDDLKLSGSCWRACRSATKVVHFFELAISASWKLHCGGRDAESVAALHGSLSIPIVCLDDVEEDEDNGYTIIVTVAEERLASNTAVNILGPTPPELRAALAFSA